MPTISRLHWKNWLCLILIAFSLCFFRLAQADGPRIDTFYDTPEGQKYTSMNILLTWERIPNGVGDVNATFFFLFQQPSSTYEGGIGFADGKISLRQQERRRFAVFSISDSHYNSRTVISEREMAWCKRFQSNQESGTQCIIEFDWEEGKIYMLQIKLVGNEGSSDIWQASVIDVKNESETIVGRLFVDRVDMQHGYGLIKENPVTYLEYFGVSNVCMGLLPVRVSWLGPFDNKANPLPIGARSQQNECNAAAASTNEHPVVIQEVAVSPSVGLANGEDLWPYLTSRYFKPSKGYRQVPRSVTAFFPTSPAPVNSYNSQRSHLSAQQLPESTNYSANSLPSPNLSGYQNNQQAMPQAAVNNIAYPIYQNPLAAQVAPPVKGENLSNNSTPTNSPSSPNMIKNVASNSTNPLVPASNNRAAKSTPQANQANNISPAVLATSKSTIAEKSSAKNNNKTTSILLPAPSPDLVKPSTPAAGYQAASSNNLNPQSSAPYYANSTNQANMQAPANPIYSSNVASSPYQANSSYTNNQANSYPPPNSPGYVNQFAIPPLYSTAMPNQPANNAMPPNNLDGNMPQAVTPAYPVINGNSAFLPYPRDGNSPYPPQQPGYIPQQANSPFPTMPVAEKKVIVDPGFLK